MESVSNNPMHIPWWTTKLRRRKQSCSARGPRWNTKVAAICRTMIEVSECLLAIDSVTKPQVLSLEYLALFSCSPLPHADSIPAMTIWSYWLTMVLSSPTRSQLDVCMAVHTTLWQAWICWNSVLAQLCTNHLHNHVYHRFRAKVVCQGSILIKCCADGVNLCPI